MHHKKAERLKSIVVTCLYESCSGDVVEHTWEMSPWEFELEERRCHSPFLPPGKLDGPVDEFPIEVSIRGMARLWAADSEE